MRAVAGNHGVLAGRWEDRRDSSLTPPFRCRWYFSWTELPSGTIAGYFAGYEGGGASVEERFHGCFKGSELVEFVWNGWDHVSGDPHAFGNSPSEIEECCDEHFDLFLRWHDRDEWERGFLCLAPGLEHGLVMLPNALFLPPRDENAMEQVAALARYTGIMSSFG